MSQKRSEDDLCRAFAEAVASSEEFKNLVLSRTKFADRQLSSRLMKDEQILARPRVAPDRWWRHWWRKLPEPYGERETDVFLVFQNTENGVRFALHVELKIKAYLSIEQARGYREGRSHFARLETRVPHNDFDVLLVANEDYLAANQVQADIFGNCISHEQVAAFVPVFKV